MKEEVDDGVQIEDYGDEDGMQMGENVAFEPSEFYMYEVLKF